jgi:flagellar biosynthesis/type III secretory pathway protein FliH
LYKLLCKDSLDANEVHPYRELDLGLPEEPAAEPSEAEPQAAEPEEIFDWSAVAPLVCLTAAQQSAAEIVTDARRQAEALRQEANEQGKALGREEAKKEMLPALTSLAQAGQSLIVFEERMVNRFTSEIVRLALEIAEKIVGKAVDEDPEIVASVLERARREVPDARLVRVRLNPADYHILAEMRPELVRMGDDGGRKFEVLPADEIPRGGCRIETEIGIVDATIPTQFEEIRRQLLDE